MYVVSEGAVIGLV